MASDESLPRFADLPVRPSDPPYSAWHWGEGDELGTLNLLTPERVAAASREVQAGVTVSLKYGRSHPHRADPISWSLGYPTHPLFNRQAFEHKVVHLAPRDVHDDVIKRKIDGARHYGFLKTNTFYNGVSGDAIRAPGSRVLGIDAAAKRGIAGRGVLVDFVVRRLRSRLEADLQSYAAAHGITYDPFATHHISLDHVKACIAEQGTELRVGDVFLVRTGFIRAYEDAADDVRIELGQRKGWRGVGVEPSKRMAEWLYDHHFSTVGGDSPTFEAWPSGPDDFFLHPVLIAGMGTQILEMLDLERLAEECKRLKRWSFLYTSAPLNVPGGVASPANALALL